MLRACCTPDRTFTADPLVQVSSKQRMNVLLYHGKKKDMITSAAALSSYSVVVTSYTMLANECGSVSNIKAGGELVDLASDEEDTGACQPAHMAACVVVSVTTKASARTWPATRACTHTRSSHKMPLPLRWPAAGTVRAW